MVEAIETSKIRTSNQSDLCEVGNHFFKYGQNNVRQCSDCLKTMKAYFPSDKNSKSLWWKLISKDLYVSKE